jgi:hypothetical protein
VVHVAERHDARPSHPRQPAAAACRRREGGRQQWRLFFFVLIVRDSTCLDLGKGKILERSERDDAR